LPVTTVLLAAAAYAQPSFYEAEPNNTPAEANQVAGAVTIMGDLGSQDQDAFQWTVSDVDAQMRWTFELEGIPGAPTIAEAYRLEYAENGVDVLAKHRLFKIGSSNGAKPGRIEDLLFKPGEYLVGVASAGSTEGGYRVHIRPGSKLRLASSPPKNATQESAQKLKLGWEYAAFIETADSWFQFKISDKETDQLWVARAQVPMGQKAQVRVRDSSGKMLSKTGVGPQGILTSEDLDLNLGTYSLEIAGETAGSIRAVVVEPIGPRLQITEAGAPGGPKSGSVKKGTWKIARRVDLTQPATGRFGETREYHYFSFDLDEQAAEQVLVLRIDADNDRTVKFCLLDAAGAELQCRQAKGTVELPDLVLTPGTWGVMAESKAAEPAAYTISLNSIAPVQPGIEAEPNDKVLQATGIPANNRIKGRFAGREEDFYRIVVTGEAQLWRFQVVGDGIVELRYHDGAGVQNQKSRPNKGQSRVRLENVFLMPGQHYVSIKGDMGGEYTFLARPLGPPDPNGEREPNDDASRAEILSFGQDRTGLLENADDWDLYRFSLTNDEHLRLTFVPPAGGALLAKLDYGTTEIGSHRTQGQEAAVVQGLFSPGDYQIRMRANQPSESQYHIKLERLSRFSCAADCEPVHTRKLEFADGMKPTSPPGDLPVTMALEPETDVVAAYLKFGQSLPAELRLTNNGPQDRSLNLESATSDYRWSAVPASDSLEIGAGESRTVPLEIQVPRDAWADQSVLISVRAFEDTGTQVETSTEIEVNGRAKAVYPGQSWSIPDSILGGPNVAWTALGGRRVPAPDESEDGKWSGVGRYFDLYFDGRVRPTVGAIVDTGRKVEPVPITVELGGGELVEVVGIILNPVGRELPAYYLDEFEVQLSLDGESFETVLRDRLRPLSIDQAYALKEPTPARFARLLLLTPQKGKSNNKIGLGEWKVVAKPGTDLSGGKGFNLASPELGGHVVWSRPHTWGGWDTNLLTEKQENAAIRLRAGQIQEWAISFQHQRAAKIARFEWVDSERAKPVERIDRVSLSVALKSPVGPWTKVGEWDRSVSPDEFVLDAPIWARYVRFTLIEPAEDSRFYVPDTLRIFEQPADESYSSILGEWGQTSPQAAYEKTRGVALDTSLRSASGNNSRDTAAALRLDQQIGGRVMLGEEEDWYKLTVPADRNTVQITLSGTPTVRTVIHVEDSTGSQVRLARAGSQLDSRGFKAVVEPGKSYWIKVEEPPRAVIFAFDNSGSVRAFATAIYRAMNAYAGDLVPGRDVANILPFGGGLLTGDWIGEPYIQQIVLNDYPRDDASSAAEESLDKATRALSARPGTKAVVIVTDAATPRFPKMWGSLEAVQPRVFTMRVGNADTTGLYEDLMQSWAMVNDGHYAFTSTQGEMDKAFDRAATLLRQPASYGLEVSAAFEKAPGPGSLQVVAGDDKGLGGAVALILDASGSMLKRMEGGRRIEIAKDLLSKAVTEHIPAGTPVALRVFGHKESNSCRTDLVIPMKPLDPAAVTKTLEGINAKNLAKTPIADSLAKVESDLKGAKGTRVVVLVTDGEETCDGDPSEVLAKLSERGIDLRLEIVGFAIDDDDLKQQFEGWAEQGGGRYFDAGNAESLERSLAEALQIPYSVFDQNGSLVAQGTVDGEALELEAGHYRITIATSPPRTVEDVEVPGEKSVVLKADGS